MKKIEIVHCKEEDFDVYIGRAMPGLPGSKWANPYRLGTDGDRDEVCDKHERDLINNPELFCQLPELRQYRRWACWCKTRRAPQTRCHGDTYLKYLLMMFPEDAVYYEDERSLQQPPQLSLF
jgi:hypothetical protein